MLVLKFISFLVLINYTLQIKFKEDPKLISENSIKNLKKISKYKVIEYQKHPFKDYTTSQIANLFGVKDMDPLSFKIRKKGPKRSLLDATGDSTTPTSIINSENNLYGSVAITSTILPLNYMVTENYPNCGSFVKNQGRCASCYALAISEALEDRICVKTNMQTKVTLSSQLIISCDRNSFGCQGGYLDKTFEFLNLYGSVTESCFPYTSGLNGIVPKCPSRCNNGSPFFFYRSQTHYTFRNSAEMKNDIFNNGPIIAGFAVFNDFLSYSSGVYKLTPGATYLGGHAVKVIGWGIENGEEFWICKNSWGTGWGEGGFFRFAMNHCCGFESNGFAALPMI